MRKHLLAAWCILTFFSTPALADTADTSRIFPLPRAELAEAITETLEANGFRVSRTALEMGRVRLDALTGPGTWQITLTPDSALATRATAIYRSQVDGAPVPEPEDLWGLLSRSSSPKTDTAVTSQDNEHNDRRPIPSIILSRIETVVCIKAELNGVPIQLSGVIITGDGFILCTAHDLRDLQEVRVVCYDGDILRGNVVRTDHHLDLALVHINRTFDTFVNVANGRNLLGFGECLYSVGCPIDLGGTVYRGVVNGPPRHVDGLPLWQVNMAIHHGSSGSPVFDVQGTLVAMVKGRYRGTESIGFLIPLETIMDFVIHVGQ